MKKTARLDKIFLQMGNVTEEQIARALARQKVHGGRLGENLLELGIITEQQLLTALSRQFRIPTATPAEKDVALDILKRLPEDAVLQDLILPLAWDEAQGILTLAVGDPGAQAAMIRAKDALSAKKVRIVLASERIISDLGLRLLSGEGRGREDSGGPRIELPELFAGAEEGESDAEDQKPPEQEVLMISRGAPLKNFLPPVFLREGVALTVASDAEQAASNLRQRDLEGILLAQDMADEFEAWVESGKLPEPRVDVTVFPSVSETLMGNPVAYGEMVRSLRAAVQALADLRCAHFGSCPPYGLIVHDLAALSHDHGLSRLARDGLPIAAHLLLPTACEYAADPVGSAEPFHAFSSTLELATRIRFPWRLDTLLDACHALFSGRKGMESGAKGSREVQKAAELLAIVWYRHNHVALDGENEAEAMISLRTGLRKQAGVLATLDTIEGYLSLIQERGGATASGGPRQVVLVGEERIARALSQELSRLGLQVIETQDLADAQTLIERSPPGAVVIDHTDFLDDVHNFVRLTRLDGNLPVYVLTDSTDPTLVLNLLDIGANDVFGPTHEFDLMAARLNHAIRNQGRLAEGSGPGKGQFSATFEVFSFLDLIQTLGHGFKSVRIDLTRSDGEQGVLFMEKGRIIHATAGEEAGAAAVYRVIAWEDDGEFTVHREDQFPPATIQDSTESLLMEGCRLLDEGKR